MRFQDKTRCGPADYARRFTKDIWRAKWDRCWVCNWGVGEPTDELLWLELHHIERRSQAPKTNDVVINWFCACNGCHRRYLATMSHAQQLALKWSREKCGYEKLADFVADCLRIRDPELLAPERVTAEDVRAHLSADFAQRMWRIAGV